MPTLFLPIHRRLFPRYLAVAAGLAMLTPLTLGVGTVFERKAEANPDVIGERQVEATIRAVQARLARLLESMEADGLALAESRVIRQVLADPATRTPTLVRPVLEAVSGTESLFRREATEGIELYRPDGALFAWSGFEAPLDRVTLREGIPDTVRTAIALDGSERRTITMWVPIRRGEEVIGMVRVMRRAQVDVPVRNEYLKNYNLADAWQNSTLPPFSVVFSDRATPVSDAALLTGLDGTVLGHTFVERPTERILVGRILSYSHGVAALWIVLFILWLLGGLWFLLDAHIRRASAEAGGRRLLIAGILLVGWGGTWWGFRYGLLALNVPARWLIGWRPGLALFDPAYLASGIGAGLLRSAGDLIVTAAFAVVFAMVLLRFALFRTASLMGAQPQRVGLARLAISIFWLALGAAAILAYIVGAKHAVLDATLTYFERSGPIPDALTLVVLMALMAGAYAAIANAAACVLMARAFAGRTKPATDLSWKAVGGLVVAFLGTVAITGSIGGTPVLVSVALFAVSSTAGALFLIGHRDRWVWPLTFRGMLFCVLVLVPLMYVVMSEADRERDNVLIEEAAEDFALGQDPRAVYAIEQVLTEARSRDLRGDLVTVVEDVEKADLLSRDSLVADSSIVDSTDGDTSPLADSAPLPDSVRVLFNDLITRLVSGSLLASLSDYSVDLAVLNTVGDTLAAYAGDALPDAGRGQIARIGKDDPLAFALLRDRYQSEDRAGFLVVRAPIGSQRGTNRYAGIGPVQAPGGSIAGWLYAQATPRLTRPLGETPYPSVLVPAELLDADVATLSYAEYDNGVLVRSRGVAPGPFQLDVGVRNAFTGNATEFWRREVLEGQDYRVYYRRNAVGESDERLDAIAVRLPTPSGFDHLFNLLRITVAGLVLGLLVYLAGLPIRRRMGLLASSRARFSDKVLSRFLFVGIATVAVTGMIGRQVIVVQNEQSVENLLRLRLQLVEAAVTADAGPGTPVSTVLENARADKASAQLGLDLHVYFGYRLVSTSRRQLVRQRFIDERLPADVYRALYAEGHRYAFAEGRIGTFSYTIGYKAIADERGRAIGAVAVPTLPEQSSIEAGQARMIAYLFGVLLVLMLGIFVTTALLADQLTRPFKRLREGLKAVGEGQTYEPIPVETQDEMGQLAEAFNEMQGQIVENRRMLAQQERELAWREMAQQVAHEIKNPLTPMKLSVQHLRRSHRPAGEDAPPNERKFTTTLDRITTTLIEQIDALSRIAGEFSSFARLPRRNPERLDLNHVVGEAAALFEDEAPSAYPVEVNLELADAPLYIEADREELRRAYINLFTNALQAMTGQRDGRIIVRTSKSAGFAHSEIQDNGTGIPVDIRARIFQPNFSTKTSGMGLGLAIVKKGIEASGGSIWFDTEEARGTTFRIRLPLAGDAPQTDV